MTSLPAPTPDPRPPAASDLGFGTRVADNSRVRLLNRDGSFNVERRGIRGRRATGPYESLLEMSWPAFLGLLLLYYLTANAIFASIYLMLGADALSGDMLSHAPAAIAPYLRAYFFSVETFATVGYGHIAPGNVRAELLVTLESFAGLLSAALVTGLAFARFSRPKASILYSRHALIAPFGNGTAFQFRCANAKSNQLIEVSVRILFSRMRTSASGARTREFIQLPLEYDRITFFALTWTVVHPIVESSPLWNATPESLAAEDAEFLVLLSGTDETSSTTVHSRTSYKPNEIVWGARYRPIFVESPSAGTIGMDLTRIHDFEFVAPRL